MEGHEQLDPVSRRIRERELNDLRAVLAIEPGRRLYYRLLDRAGVFRCSMTGDERTFFLEGQRNLGLAFLNDLMEADPSMELLGALTQEHRRQAEADEAERERERQERKTL